VRLHQLAYVAAAMEIASAVPSVFWTLGGTLLLDTVGGSIERLARAGSPSGLALGATSSPAKVGTAPAVALVGFRREHSNHRQPGMSRARAQVSGSRSAQDERRHPFPSLTRQGRLEIDSTKEAQ
jgi:hypothetical protein